MTIQQFSVRIQRREIALERALQESVVIQAEVERLRDENRRMSEQAERRAEQLRQLPALRAQLGELRGEVGDLQRDLQARALASDSAMCLRV